MSTTLDLEEVRKAYDVTEIAKLLGVARMTVLHRIYRGELRAWRIGSKWKVTEADFKAFVDQCRPVEPSDAAVR